MAGRADLSLVPYWTAGLAAGVVGAAFFLSALSGSPVIGLLLYFAPLPVFFAGLGWGAVAAGIAALTGMMLLTLVGGFTAGLLFFVLNGAVPFWLVRQALLYRPAGRPAYPAPTVSPAASPPTAGPDTPTLPGSTGVQPPVEWYPAGGLVVWTAAIAVAFFVFATIGVSLAGYKGGIEDALRQMLVQAALETGSLDALLQRAGVDAPADTVLALIIAVLPAAAGALWILLTLGNMRLAQALSERMEINLRPAPAPDEMHLPLAYMGVYAGAVALSLIPGETAYFGGTVAVMLSVPYFLLGLGIIHGISRGWTARIAFLGLFYMALVLVPWLVMPVWLLGLLESGIGIRARIAALLTQARGTDKSEEKE